MPMSGVWTPDQTFKCIDFNCGCELKIITPPQRSGLQTLSRPMCVCGGPMIITTTSDPRKQDGADGPVFSFDAERSS
jgi:hypothetical protein